MDIVDRLRDSQPEGTTGGYLLNDAADEIERLRKVRDELIADMKQIAQSVFEDSAAFEIAQNAIDEHGGEQ